MEDTLGEITNKSLQTALLVLILVLVEDTLGVHLQECASKVYHVLILVLVEDTLGEVFVLHGN